ncbi:hypothetical protein [Geodermatophilus sp. URMC 63]
MSEEGSVPADLFQWLCRELGHAADEVMSVRINRERVVLLKDPPMGPLQKFTYEPLDGRLTLVDQEPAGVRDEGRGRR